MRRSGFTLIELVISTGIIMLVVASTLPAFLQFQAKQNLVSAAQSVRDMILEAQNYALAPRPEKPVGGDLYRIVFLTSDPPGYQIDEYNPTTPDSPWDTVKIGGLPSGISFCSFSHDELFSGSRRRDVDVNKGIQYSISQLGKIEAPILTVPLEVVIRHKSLAEQERITVGSQTGRVDVELATTPVSC